MWQDIFGFKAESTHRLEKENVVEDILKVGAAKSPFVVEIDLMQPIDPNKSPKVNNENNSFCNFPWQCSLRLSENNDAVYFAS